MVIFVVVVDFIESFEFAVVAYSFVANPFDFAEIVGIVDIAGIEHFVDIAVEIVGFVDIAEEIVNFVEIADPVEEIAYLDSFLFFYIYIIYI